MSLRCLVWIVWLSPAPLFLIHLPFSVHLPFKTSSPLFLQGGWPLPAPHHIFAPQPSLAPISSECPSIAFTRKHQFCSCRQQQRWAVAKLSHYRLTSKRQPREGKTKQVIPMPTAFPSFQLHDSPIFLPASSFALRTSQTQPKSPRAKEASSFCFDRRQPADPFSAQKTFYEALILNTTRHRARTLDPGLEAPKDFDPFVSLTWPKAAEEDLAANPKLKPS